MDAADAARAWVEAWTDGWLTHDPDVIAARYADTCEFRSHPYRDPVFGRAGARAYAVQAFAEERSAEPAFGEPIVGSEGRAAVEYRASITAADGGVPTTRGHWPGRPSHGSQAVETHGAPVRTGASATASGACQTASTLLPWRSFTNAA